MSVENMTDEQLIAYKNTLYAERDIATSQIDKAIKETDSEFWRRTVAVAKRNIGKCFIDRDNKYISDSTAFSDYYLVTDVILTTSATCRYEYILIRVDNFSYISISQHTEGIYKGNLFDRLPSISTSEFMTVYKTAMQKLDDLIISTLVG